MQKIGENAYEREQRELMWGEGQGELIRPGCRSDPLEIKKVLDCSSKKVGQSCLPEKSCISQK